MTIRAMVMAAGAGTRLRPLTQHVPKPLVPIANRPVLEYTIENLKRHGITEIILNLHNHPDMIRRHFKDGAAWGVRIHYSFEPKLLGTAGGVKNVESFLKRGTFLVMSGDGLTRVNLKNLLAFHGRKKSFGSMGLKGVDTRFEYGVTVTRPNGAISRFIEKPKWSDIFSNQVNTGIYVFEPGALALMPKGKLYDFGHEFWPLLLKSKRPIFAAPIKEYWCDVGNLTEYRRAQRDFLDGLTGFRMPGKQIRRGIWVEPGAKIAAGARLEAPCLVGRSTEIAKGAWVGPYTVIGSRCRIAPGSALKHTTLWDNVQIGKGVHLDNCIIGHGVKINTPLALHDASAV